MNIERVNGDEMVNLEDVIVFLESRKLKSPGFEHNDFVIGWNAAITGITEELKTMKETV